MLATSVVLLMVSFLFWVLVCFAKNLADKWAELPNFCINKVGGKTAVCGYLDFYDNTKVSLIRRPGKEYLIAVPDTFVLDNEERVRGHFLSRQITPNLFVPLASEKFFYFAVQRTMFVPNTNIEEFEKRIIEQNLKNSWRRRFAKRFVHNRIIDGSQFVFGIATVAFFLIFVLFVLEENGDRPIYFHSTNPDSVIVSEVQQPIFESNGMLAREDEQFDVLIIKESVREIVPIGGGLSQVCTSYKDIRYDCGVADSSLGIKIGDIVYIRSGDLLRWKHVRKEPQTIAGSSYESNTWIITEKEAQALLATGKFKLNE